MFLSDRKIQILEAIINDYIATGEPIGSRTITKKYNFGLSSATIRNEMSDLEDMGYITQPHASAGRSPTDKGYRLYVDKLMKYRELTKEETEFLENMVRSNINKIDYLMEETAKAVSLLTNYTTLASPVKSSRTKIKLIQLLPVDTHSVAFVLITSDKTVKNSIFTVTEEAPDNDTLLRLSAILNSYLSQKSAKDIGEDTLAAIARAAAPLGDCSELLRLAVEASIVLLLKEDTASVFLSGAKNILEFPEFNDIKLAKNLLQAFEEKELLVTLLNEAGGEAMQVVIGCENSVEEMKNCSIIKTSIRTSDANCGTIGILGPTRMDYAQAASVLNVIAGVIEKTIKALSGG